MPKRKNRGGRKKRRDDDEEDYDDDDNNEEYANKREKVSITDLNISKSSEDMYLDEQFGEEDDINECFICNFNKDCYPRVDITQIESLNRTAAINIKNHGLLVAIRELHTEYCKIRKIINGMIELGQFDMKELPDWPKRSIRFHYTKHGSSLASVSFKLLRLTNKWCDDANQSLTYEDGNGKKFIHDKVANQLVKMGSAFKNIAETYDRLTK
jgi:hypothetical protein